MLHIGLLSAEDKVEGNAIEAPARWFSRMMEREIGNQDWRIATLAVVEQGANGGAPAASLELARRYELGEGVPRDPARAVSLLRAAAELGQVTAQYLLAYHYIHEKPVPGGIVYVGNYQLAEEWLEKAVEQGHVQAAVELGDLYHFGKLPRDTASASKWFKRAAQAGNAEAARKLAKLLAWGGETATGAPVPAQPEEAVRWYQFAAQHGDADAPVELANILDGGLANFRHLTDREAAKSWLLKSASQGNLGAKALLAVRYGNLSSVSSADIPALKDASYYRRSSPECLLMGMLHETGRFVPRDPTLALVYYLSGTTFPDDLAIARQAAIIRLYVSDELKLYDTDKRAGLPEDATYVPTASLRLQLAELFWSGNRTVTKDQPRALKWFFLAAQAGSAPAMRRLGEFWEQGVNGEPDPAEAQRWYRRAELAEQTRSPALKSEEGR